MAGIYRIINVDSTRKRISIYKETSVCPPANSIDYKPQNIHYLLIVYTLANLLRAFKICETYHNLQV